MVLADDTRAGRNMPPIAAQAKAVSVTPGRIDGVYSAWTGTRKRRGVFFSQRLCQTRLARVIPHPFELAVRVPSDRDGAM